jgi:enediyne polyketide synthase
MVNTVMRAALTPVAILGAALRFPGASDPSSFHEITVAGRRMFRELARRTDNGGLPEHGERPAGRPSRLAALLDDAAPRFGRDDALAGGITARHILAAETAAAALADVPPAGRAVAAERIGVFIADIPEPGTADVRDWVHRHLGTLAADDTATSPARGRDAHVGGDGAARPAGAVLHDLLLGTIGAVRANHGSTSVTGTAVVNGPVPAGLHCSLRAVTAACEALNSGQFDLVLAGGVAKGVDGWMHGHPAASATDDHVRVYDAARPDRFPAKGAGSSR